MPLPDAEILKRVVALNAQRAAEEASGTIRYLRPEYQAKSVTPAQAELHTLSKRAHTTDAKDSKSPARKPAKTTKLPWPKTMAERTKAIDTYLATEPQPIMLPALTQNSPAPKRNTSNKSSKPSPRSPELVAILRIGGLINLLPHSHNDYARLA